MSCVALLVATAARDHLCDDVDRCLQLLTRGRSHNKVQTLLCSGNFARCVISPANDNSGTAPSLNLNEVMRSERELLTPMIPLPGLQI